MYITDNKFLMCQWLCDHCKTQNFSENNFVLIFFFAFHWLVCLVVCPKHSMIMYLLNKYSLLKYFVMSFEITIWGHEHTLAVTMGRSILWTRRLRYVGFPVMSFWVKDKMGPSWLQSQVKFSNWPTTLCQVLLLKDN